MSDPTARLHERLEAAKRLAASVPARENVEALVDAVTRHGINNVEQGYSERRQIARDALTELADLAREVTRLQGLVDELREALDALNELRSNVVATQSASWSNTLYPLVAILDAAGLEVFEPTEEQLMQHFDCYGGAGGYPGHLLSEPGDHARWRARRLAATKKPEEGAAT